VKPLLTLRSAFSVLRAPFLVLRSSFFVPFFVPFFVLSSSFLVLRSSFFVPALLAAQSPRALLDRAVAEFEQGQFAQSARTFDELAKLIPDEAPQLWQRGIALYYAGRFTDCRRQFESHRTVNPDDVENAAWHFLCVAREQTPERARAALLPVGPDARVPMREVYQMIRGTLTSEDVLKSAGTQLDGLFYAHLYIGLYSEAIGRKDLAQKHIKEAASDRYARVGGYMHMVARVHARRS
jgi:lipoprotein NlpI